MIKRKRKAVKFTDKKHSFRGIVSLILGILSGIAFLILSYLSSLSKGNGGLAFGVAGMILFVMSIVGLVLSIKSFKETDIYFTASIIGLILNGLFVCLYFILYIIGLSL
jgi:uncharacterized membrane protein (UPF0136 family)